MSALVGAAKAFGVNTDEITTVLDQTVASAVSRKLVDPYTQLLPLNETTALAAALGNMLVADINNADPDRDTKKALARLPECMDNKQYRRSSPRDYVYDAVTAKNPDGSKKYKLDLALNTLATKVTFTKSKCSVPEANGIEYLYGQSLYRADPRAKNTNGGKPGSVRATKEVIVAGGAFNSPQILKLSGVGPKEE